MKKKVNQFLKVFFGNNASKLTLCLVCFFMSFNLLKAQTIKGILVDAQTKETLVGVNVIVKGSSRGTITQIDGSFIYKLEPGKHTLLFSYIGYLDVEKECDVDGGKTIDIGKIELFANTLELDEVKVVASFARDRMTPVALSTIRPEIIVEKLGGQEFPEILKSTPSVYASKGSGGFGDSRINIRGFDSNNIGVLVNGVPINDMESGKVYWSNWAGLSDVTSNMQVQRGLGASKLALSSVGGTINIITKSTDAEKGGSAYAGMGNDGYNKYSFNLSTGLMENGWAVSIAGATTFGEGYVAGTNYRGYSYFANISKVINKNHRLSFQAFGAPQWHNQRGNYHTIATYRGQNPDLHFKVQNGAKFNSDYGYRNGKAYGGNYGHNEFHKPQVSLNHYWTISPTSSLSTVLYGSISSGGGRRIDGDKNNLMTWDRNKDVPTAGVNSFYTSTGLLNYDAAEELNKASLDGSQIIIGKSINSHQWFGLLSSYKKQINNFEITGGLDARYYVGQHYKEVVDLLGGRYFINSSNKNRPAETPLEVGDKYAYNNDGVVAWLGLFGQAEYSFENFSAFASASLSSNSYLRKDYFLYTPENRNSEWISFLPFSFKAGANYNISEQHNVFVNGGYFTRAPYFNTVFPNNTNEINKGAKMEKIISAELGYGYTARIVKFKLSAYTTNWKDKGLRKTIGSQIANIPGLNALHSGLELEGQLNPIPKMFITGMVSLGQWVWQNDVNFKLFDDNGVQIGDEYVAYLKGIHVGNSAQQTAAIGVNYDVFQDIKIGADLNYYGKHFADFEPTNRTKMGDTKDAWKLPNASTLDVNVRWKFKFAKLDAVMYANVANLLDTEYITDARDGEAHDMNSAMVYYGFGRTWSAGFRINF